MNLKLINRHLKLNILTLIWFPLWGLGFFTYTRTSLCVKYLRDGTQLIKDAWKTCARVDRPWEAITWYPGHLNRHCTFDEAPKSSPSFHELNTIKNGISKRLTFGTQQLKMKIKTNKKKNPLMNHNKKNSIWLKHFFCQTMH